MFQHLSKAYGYEQRIGISQWDQLEIDGKCELLKMYWDGITSKTHQRWEDYKNSLDGVMHNLWMQYRYYAYYILLRYMIRHNKKEEDKVPDAVTWESVLKYCFCLPENVLVNLYFHPKTKTVHLICPFHAYYLYNSHIGISTEHRSEKKKKCNTIHTSYKNIYLT